MGFFLLVRDFSYLFNNLVFTLAVTFYVFLLEEFRLKDFLLLGIYRMVLLPLFLLGRFIILTPDIYLINVLLLLARVLFFNVDLDWDLVFVLFCPRLCFEISEFAFALCAYYGSEC